jgi:hypothetical protein
MTRHTNMRNFKMTTLTKTALTALAFVVCGTTLALANGAGPPTHRISGPNPSHPDYNVECRVHGDSFYVINWGNSVLDSGRQISWRSPTTNDSGVVLLPKMLAPGEEVQLADILSDVVLPHSPCNVALV